MDKDKVAIPISANIYFSMLSSSEVGNLKKELIYYTDSIGTYCGYGIVAERVVGHSLIHYSCIVNYERQPLRYAFTLYRPKGS